VCFMSPLWPYSVSTQVQLQLAAKRIFMSNKRLRNLDMKLNLSTYHSENFCEYTIVTTITLPLHYRLITTAKLIHRSIVQRKIEGELRSYILVLQTSVLLEPLVPVPLELLKTNSGNLDIGSCSAVRLTQI